MKKLVSLKSFLLIGIAVAMFSGCTSLNKTMREPNSKVQFVKSDFTLSDQLSAQATSTKILCIDWSRLFMSKAGTVVGGASGISLANIPVFGSILSDKTSNYALYELMQNNPGYDVVFYPQYESKTVRPIGLGFIFKTTTVKVTAKLGKLK